MPNYEQGKIYTIRCRTDDNLIYVGSTIQPLCERLAQHKRRSKNCQNRLIYITINNDWNNWYIELYSLYPCNSKEELDKKEGEIIRLIGTLNSKIAGRNKKEYDKIHYQQNKEHFKKYNKEYYEQNKDKILKQQKENYEQNKDKILEKITCICGCIINKESLNRHLKTKKHTDFILLNNQIN